MGKNCKKQGNAKRYHPPVKVQKEKTQAMKELGRARNI